MPSPHRRSRSGQAAADYVALLCLVAVVLTGAGVAVAGVSLPRAVVAQVRAALCVVDGDVCLTSQARAAGLEPCVLAAEAYTTRWSASGLIFRSSQEHAYLIERRSDGRISVTAGHERQGGAGVGVGVKLGPAALSGDAGATAGWRSGMVWELDGPAALRRFLARAPKPHRLENDADWRRAGLPAPDVRYLAGGASAELSASLEAGVVVPLVSAGGRAALGRRVGPDGTTWFFELPEASAEILGGEIGGVGPWAVELHAGRGGRVERLVMRAGSSETEIRRIVDLHDPAAAAAARDLLVPARSASAARALSRMGRLQRDVYRVRELDSSPDIELAAAVAGLGHADRRTERRLVASTVTEPGGRTVRRMDCLAVGRPR